MRPSQPTRNLARRRLVFFDPADWRPAMNARWAAGRCSSTRAAMSPAARALLGTRAAQVPRRSSVTRLPPRESLGDQAALGLRERGDYEDQRCLLHQQT